ncbi:MAG: NAD-dependent succinate-semialdehyde dehydrogenase [Alistipes sp.]|nr:NAD-dependent succinate-semialdehyde dehydrogenase [Alistipes sp.]
MENVLTRESPIKTVNPATGVTEMVFDVMSDQQIDTILDTADMAFRRWKATDVSDRTALLSRLARAFRENREELARLAAVEMGKVYREGLTEADLCAKIFDYYAANGSRLLEDRPYEFPSKAYVMYEPLGVILSIQPWNFPYSQVVRNAAPIILAGNTMVLKHSSNVPQCAAMIERLFREAGSPEGVFTNLFIKGPKASEIIADDRIKGATFTGGVNAGRSVAEAAGRKAKKCVMELSGIDPMIVLDDADVELAAKTAVAMRTRNAGQVCNSPKRVIVDKSVVDEFVDRAGELLRAVKVGDPLDEATGMGPLSSVKAAQKIKEQIDKSVEEGAVPVYGGTVPQQGGAFLVPALLRDVRPGMTAFDEEIFGPVISVVTADGEEDALKLANDCRFALGASVFSTDGERAERLARKVDAGMVGINTMAGSTPELPYGGTKDSGYGRELSDYGVHEFANHKLVRF